MIDRERCRLCGGGNAPRARCERDRAEELRGQGVLADDLPSRSSGTLRSSGPLRTGRSLRPTGALGTGRPDRAGSPHRSLCPHLVLEAPPAPAGPVGSGPPMPDSATVAGLLGSLLSICSVAVRAPCPSRGKGHVHDAASALSDWAATGVGGHQEVAVVVAGEQESCDLERSRSDAAVRDRDRCGVLSVACGCIENTRLWTAGDAVDAAEQITSDTAPEVDDV